MTNPKRKSANCRTSTPESWERHMQERKSAKGERAQPWRRFAWKPRSGQRGRVFAKASSAKHGSGQCGTQSTKEAVREKRQNRRFKQKYYLGRKYCSQWNKILCSSSMWSKVRDTLNTCGMWDAYMLKVTDTCTKYYTSSTKIPISKQGESMSWDMFTGSLSVSIFY